MTTTAPLKKETLNVPGASLYYEVRGSGPVLLMMPGGPADARMFQQVADDLATGYTVVTYDPRGLSRSTVGEPIDERRIVQVFADDVKHLLDATASEPAFVLGVSGGATIGLDLAARYGDRVRALVAHEPPSPSLQPDPAAARREMEAIAQTHRTAGLYPAMQKFAAHARIKSGPPPAPQNPTPEELEGMAQMQKNMDFFLGPLMTAIANFEPDLRSIRQGPCRVIAAVGAESEGEMAHIGGRRLAELLGTEVEVFPGGHGGVGEHPREFGVRLRELLVA